jgi:hypothetical protein
MERFKRRIQPPAQIVQVKRELTDPCRVGRIRLEQRMQLLVLLCHGFHVGLLRFISLRSQYSSLIVIVCR